MRNTAAFALFWAIVVLASPGARAQAAVNDVSSTESFVTDWVLVGMFDNPPVKDAAEGRPTRAGFDTDYLVSLGGEARAKLAVGAVVKTSSWDVGPAIFVKTDPGGMVSIDPLYRRTDFKLAYAYCEIRSDSEQTVYGHSGSNDGIKIWVNGEEVLNYFVQARNADRDQNQFVARLHPGLNPLLVKIDNDREDWNFTLELYTEKYEKERFPSIVRQLAVIPETRNIASDAGKLGYHVEFLPHSLAFSPVAQVTLETLDGKVLAKAAPGIGEKAQIEVPSQAGAVLILKASVADFAGKALSGSGKVLRGDIAAIKADLASRLAALSAAEPRGMSRDAWMKHLALAKYYHMLLGFDGTRDERMMAALRDRDASVTEVTAFMTEVLMAMEAGRDVFAGKTGSMRGAYISTVDGSAQPYVYYVPRGYDASRQWPLVVQLHGRGGTSGETWEFSWNDASFCVRVDGRGIANGYTNLAEDDIFEAVADIRRHYNIDPSRILLTGSSMGGMGTWAVASRYPDFFAAAAAYCGVPSQSPIENLANVPFWSLHDQVDWTVVIDRDRWGIRLLQDWGYPARMNESRGFGHSASVGARASGLKVTDWLLTHTRVGAPARIVYTTESPERGKAYWVAIRDFAVPSIPATVRAAAREDNMLYLRMDNVATLEVNAPPALFDTARPIEVVIDSMPRRLSAPAGGAFFVHRNGAEWEVVRDNPVPAGGPRRYTIGGLSNLYSGEPLLIVQGTSGPDELVAAMAQLAGELRGTSSGRGQMDFATIPVKLDTEVTDADMRTRNLVLIGGPSQNAVTGRIAVGLAAVEKDGRVSVGSGISCDLAGRGYTLYHYNPLTPDRLVFVISSAEKAFYSLRGGVISTELSSRLPMDFVVADTSPARYVRVISWNSEWRPDERFLTAGKLPAAFGDPASVWEEMGQSIRGLANAHFALCPLPRGGRGGSMPFDTASATWEDAQVLWGRSPVVAADVRGAELLEIISAAKETGGAQMLPQPDQNSIDQAAIYRIAMPEDMASMLAQTRQKNLDTIRFVSYSPFDGVRKRLEPQ